MLEVFKKNAERCTVQSILRESDFVAPKVIVDFFALLKMESYIQQCDKEIGWLGIVEKNNDTYFITDVNLIKQDVTAVTTDLHEEGLQNFAEELLARGREDLLNKVRCWGHSHVNMAVSPSNQDDETFKEYYSKCDYFIRIIANKSGMLRLDLADNERGLIYKNIDWKIKYNEDFYESIKMYEETQKKIQLKLNKLKEETKKYVQESIKKYVKFPENKTNIKNNSMLNNTWTDEDYYGNYYLNEKEEDKYSLLPKITIYPRTNKEEKIYLDDIIDEEDIYKVWQSGKINLIKETYKNVEEFKGYTWGDWNKVLVACEDYVELFYN